MRILLTVFVLIFAPLSLAQGNPNGGPSLPATLFIPWEPYPGLEPNIPGDPQPVKGCGYIVGREIIIKDTVVLSEPAWGVVIPFPYSQHIGVEKTSTFSLGTPNADGCLSQEFLAPTHWILAWGIGSHLFEAYQVTTGAKPKKVAEWRWDTYPHHQYQVDEERVWCILYNTPAECGVVAGGKIE